MELKWFFLIACSLNLFMADFSFATAMDESAIIDKIKGGWVGQMAGVTWGAPTEFAAQGRILDDSEVPVWSPETINNGFGQDDIYVEIPFLDTMKDHGVNAGWTEFGNSFLGTSFGLAHANYYARSNLRSGILAPDNAHYDHTEHVDDIDWQIEADYAGQMNPGQVNSAIELAWRAGHVINYGDGVYGGVYVSAMHAKAFTAANVDEIIEAGRQSVPAGSKFRQVIEDVISWKNAGNTWEQNWNLLQNKWGHDDRCPDGKTSEFNIDAKLNAAYVLIGLLYGNGDLEQSMRITMRCGQDSDCNPSTVGGILGNFIGYSGIPSKWKSSFDMADTKFYATSYSFNDAVNLNVDLARQSLLMGGGSINGATWNLPDQGAVRPPILEQWPLVSNDKPVLIASAETTGKNASFRASATDSDGIKSYQWFFGDLSYADGASVTHTYSQNGVYVVVAYVTDMTGNTAWKVLSLNIGGMPVNIAPQGDIIASVTAPLGSGNPDIEVIRDEIKPPAGYDGSLLQYDSFVGDTRVHDEYYGYAFNEEKKFTKLVLLEGKHFSNGGWFANGTLKIQVRQGGVWTNVSAAVSPVYPYGDEQSDYGPSFDEYTFTLQNIVGDGVRIYGTAGGSANFISIGELEVWAFPANNAQYISQSVPSTMVKGQTYPVSVTLENTGTNTWTATSGYRLGSQNPQDNGIWGTGRVYLSAGDSIASGASKTFTFNVVAPNATGSYNFQWRMLRESVEWFGEYTPNLAITVVTSTTTTTTSTSTMTTSTTTTTTSMHCVMPGNDIPCGEISLSEIVSSIIQWTEGTFSLGGVIDLINSWADPAEHPPR
jgi:hypothetical protein